MKIYKGRIVYSKNKDELVVYEKAFIVIENGKIKGIFEHIPKEYSNVEVVDFGSNVIIPAFSDLHVHAPQYPQRGLAMDKLLYDWLNEYTFPLEDKYKDNNYAKAVYTAFVSDLLKHGTMHAAIFGTIHNEACDILMNLLEDAHIQSFVGKVNMNINSPEYLIEDTESSINNTLVFVKKHYNNKYAKPILTPRFAPTCSFDLLEKLGKISSLYKVGMQTHIVESIWERDAAKKCYDGCKCDMEIYEKAGLLDNEPIIAAHFIFPSKRDINILKKHHGFAIHCPDATTNVIAGIMKTGSLLDEGVNIAIGSDIAAGQYLGIYRGISSAVRLSKIKSFYEKNERSISFNEAFYSATKKAGEIFDHVGTFEEGYYFDALVIGDLEDDFHKLKAQEVVERFCYSGEVSNIKERFLRGNKVKI